MEHPWSEEDGGEVRLTQVGLLMFGSENSITGVFPNYRLNYHECDGRDKYRVTSASGTWSGNVFDFYLKVSGKLFNMNKHPFRLNADVHEDDNNIKT